MNNFTPIGEIIEKMMETVKEKDRLKGHDPKWIWIDGDAFVHPIVLGFLRIKQWLWTRTGYYSNKATPFSEKRVLKFLRVALRKHKNKPGVKRGLEKVMEELKRRKDVRNINRGRG